jgi:hypothetical protein
VDCALSGQFIRATRTRQPRHGKETTMQPLPLNHARRALLAGALEVAGLLALAAAAGGSRPAEAKAAKSDFMYQDHRHEGKSCGECKFFVPDGPYRDLGSCSIIDGTVSRDGWCIAFSPKILA